MIEYWAHQVGCDDLIVRDYDRLHNGAIFDDFSFAVGLPPLGEVEIPPVRPNLRIDNNFIEYARVWALFAPARTTPPSIVCSPEWPRSLHLPRR